MVPVHITSLRVDSPPLSRESIIPYLKVNITFKVPEEDEEYLKMVFMAGSEDYQKVISIADPEKHRMETLESFFRKSNFVEALRIIPKITAYWWRTLTSINDDVWSRSYKGDFWCSLNWGWLEDSQNSGSLAYSLIDSDDYVPVGYVHSIHGKSNAKAKFTWTYADPHLVYLEKFDTFWYRDYISDCAVTRAVLSELAYYKETQNLKDTYRFTNGSILIRHIETLHKYWD